MPSVARVAVLTSANPPNSEQVKRREAAARALRLELTEFPISMSEQLPAAFSKMTETRAEAVLVHSTLWFVDANSVAALALKHRLPAIHNLREFALAGALMYAACVGCARRTIYSLPRARCAPYVLHPVMHFPSNSERRHVRFIDCEAPH